MICTSLANGLKKLNIANIKFALFLYYISFIKKIIYGGNEKTH